MVVFERPIGAAPDTKELEYVSALHQSGPRLRTNGSIKDEDIKLYLRSRFGIEVTLEQVRSTILHGMGGGDAGDADEDAVIDLMELTAIILIPLLLKASIVEGNGGTLPDGVLVPPDRLLQDVIQMIVHDSGVSATGPGSEQGAEPEIFVDANLIKEILLIYGEVEMANDESLIQEMLDACKQDASYEDDEGGNEQEGGVGYDVNVPFTPRTFGRALTRDVQLYDLRNETKQSSLIQDIFGDTRNTPKNIRRANANKVKKDDTNVIEQESPDDDVQNASPSKKVTEINEITRIYTAPAIDVQAGTYRSKALIVSLWGSVLFGLVIVATNAQQNSSDCAEYYVPNGSFTDNAAGISCDAFESIANWLIRFALFCLLGMILIGLGGLGNYVGNTRWYLPLLGCIFVFFFSYWNFVFGDLPKEENFYMFLRIMSTLLGTFTMYFHLTHMITIIFKSYDFEKSKWGVLLGFSALKQELQVKQAAAYKLNKLATNARNIHYRASSTTAFKTYFGHGLSSFALHGTEYIQAGGLFWFWRKFRDGTIFNEEGMWYSARLVAANMSQFFISLFILLLGIYCMHRTIDNYGQDKAQAQLEWLVGAIMDRTIDENAIVGASLDVFNNFISYLDQFGIAAAQCSEFVQNQTAIDSICEFDPGWGYYNCSNLETSVVALCALVRNPGLSRVNPDLAVALLNQAGLNVTDVLATIRTQVAIALDSATGSLYPSELWMLTVPLGFGIAVAILTALQLAFSYIPSVTTTVIQLRTGVIPSLGDSTFESYRVAPDTVTLLTGTLFWGCLVSSILFGFVIAFIIFIFLWQGSAVLTQRLVVLAIGVTVILLIRVAVVACCKVVFFKGLYRYRPAGANMMLLAFEWANYIFTTAFILVRMVKLILVAVSSIGKIDRRFLAKGVGQVGPLELDPYPTIHTRDLVAHDAHRHPYIETLGLMYLMKLRYADSFGNRAGSAWRLIFVYALMPWFHKYRIREDDYAAGNGGDDDGKDFQNVLNETSVSRPSHSSMTLVVLPTHTARPLLTLNDVGVDVVGDDDGTAQTMREMEAENARLKESVKLLTKQLKNNKPSKRASAPVRSIKSVTAYDSTEFIDKTG